MYCRKEDFSLETKLKNNTLGKMLGRQKQKCGKQIRQVYLEKQNSFDI